MVKCIGQKAPRPIAGDLTERHMAEPLLSYFSYGMLRPAPGVCKVRVHDLELDHCDDPHKSYPAALTT